MTTGALTLPDADVPPLRGGPELRWGVAGPGRIAAAFVDALRRHTDQSVAAVGSRSVDRAAAFARHHGIARGWGSYESLVGDPGVDIVYVAVPNSVHREVAELALNAGKHVLVEKPMGIDADDAAAIQTAARSAGRFAMEGLWTRFLPQTAVLSRILDEGMLGEVALVTADFGECFDPAVERSVFDPAMGGGALRDIGIYSVWFAHLVLGPASDVRATGTLTPGGVDTEARVTLRGTGQGRAELRTTMLQQTPTVAGIVGTAGRLDFAAPFLMPGGFTVATSAGETTWQDGSGLRALDGLAWEAAAVAMHIDQGLTQSPLHSFADTSSIVAVLDRARSLIGA